MQSLHKHVWKSPWHRFSQNIWTDCTEQSDKPDLLLCSSLININQQWLYPTRQHAGHHLSSPWRHGRKCIHDVRKKLGHSVEEDWFLEHRQWASNHLRHHDCGSLWDFGHDNHDPETELKWPPACLSVLYVNKCWLCNWWAHWRPVLWASYTL